jgi:hypothetical protein
MEVKNCKVEGCLKKKYIEDLCRSCFQRTFVINSLEKKVINSKENKTLCISKTKKGTECKRFQSEGCNEFCNQHFKFETKQEKSIDGESIDFSIGSDSKIKCKGLTSKNTPCRRYEGFNCEGLCIQHFKIQRKEDKLEEKINKLKIF